MQKNFWRALIVAVITVGIDFIFHYLFTNPMETMTYFVIKFLLAFLVASGLFNLNHYLQNTKKRIYIVPLAGLIFSTMMSIYYRAWELAEVHVPIGTRAPDIIGIARENLLAFSGTWWIGHAVFFVIGVLIASRLIADTAKMDQ